MSKSSRGIVSVIIECQPLMEEGLSLIHDISRFFLAVKKPSFIFIRNELTGKT